MTEEAVSHPRCGPNRDSVGSTLLSHDSRPGPMTAAAARLEGIALSGRNLDWDLLHSSLLAKALPMNSMYDR
jgi:hypothetical protein